MSQFCGSGLRSRSKVTSAAPAAQVVASRAKVSAVRRRGDVGMILGSAAANGEWRIANGSKIRTPFATRYSLFAILASHRRQRRHDVLDQVVGVLEAGGEAQEPVADAELVALRRREALVRGGGRVRDQALGVAEIVADAYQLERVLEAEGAGLAALDLERHQGRAAPHLLERHRGLRMVGAARIDQARNLRM